MKRRLLLFLSVLALLSPLGFFLALSAARVQQGGRVKGGASELPDAAELREQIARVEKMLPQFPDRGAALYFLSTPQKLN